MKIQKWTTGPTVKDRFNTSWDAHTIACHLMWKVMFVQICINGRRKCSCLTNTTKKQVRSNMFPILVNWLYIPTHTQNMRFVFFVFFSTFQINAMSLHHFYNQTVVFNSLYLFERWEILPRDFLGLGRASLTFIGILQAWKQKLRVFAGCFLKTGPLAAAERKPTRCWALSRRILKPEFTALPPHTSFGASIVYLLGLK